MTTLERPREEIRAPITAAPEKRPPGYAMMAILAVLALVLGGIIGWMIRGDGATEADILLAGEGEITARHEQMLDIVRDGEQAWRDGDVDAVLATFTPDGTFEAFNNVYRVDDGSFAAFFESGTWTSLDLQEPVLVRGNEMFTFHRFGGQDLSQMLTFTETGEMLITSHVINTNGGAADSNEVGAIVLAGEGELTARQEQMLDHVRDIAQAWRDGDVDAILAQYSPNATFEAFDRVYRVDDGSFAAYLGGGEWSSLELYEPMLVHDDEVFTFHQFGGVEYSETFTFTPSGELLVTSHVVHT